MYLHVLVALWMERRGEGCKERLLDGYWNDLSQGGGHWLREVHLKDILGEDQEDLIPDLVGETWSGERNKSQFQDFSLCPFCWNMLGLPTKIEKSEELVKVKVTQLCLILCDPMDCTVHGILQARILEWLAFPFSSGSSRPRDRTQVSHSAGRFFNNWAIREAQQLVGLVEGKKKKIGFILVWVWGGY